MKEASSKLSDVSLVAPVQSMKARKSLKHQLKVMTFDWSPDQRHIFSGGEVSYSLHDCGLVLVKLFKRSTS